MQAFGHEDASACDWIVSVVFLKLCDLLDSKEGRNRSNSNSNIFVGSREFGYGEVVDT